MFFRDNKIKASNHAVAVDTKALQFLGFQSLLESLHSLKFLLAFAHTEPRR